MQSIRKLNLKGPRTSDISLKFIESPFSKVYKYFCNYVTNFCQTREGVAQVQGIRANLVYIVSLIFKKWRLGKFQRKKQYKIL